jgi:hypothetical protein
MELLQAVDVEYEGEECVFFTQAGVSHSIPLMAGRETFGFPKKVGEISFVRHEDIVGVYYERPHGLRLITAVFREISPVEPVPESISIKGITLRVITSKFQTLKARQDQPQHPVLIKQNVRRHNGGIILTFFQKCLDLPIN